jgi:cysteine desulfurase family protein (TIGR01976 family)
MTSRAPDTGLRAERGEERVSRERTSPVVHDAVATVAEIREQFPALERRQDGKLVAYFDGPGGTQVPRGVVEAMRDYLYHHNANTHWVYPTSVETDAAIADARAAAADFLNARANEIAFGQNMTTLTFHLARALGRGWGRGDEVVITELDHHANQAPWRALERERGITVKRVRMDPARGQLDWDDLARSLTPRTKLLAIGAASNAIGTITDVAEAGKLARAVGALTFVDAVHYAPHQLVDVQRMDCDFLTCSAYKFYGPHIGILYGRHELLRSLDVPKLDPAPETAPERLETGTQSHESMVGAAAAIDFLASVAQGPTRRERLTRAFDALHERATRLLATLHGGLSQIDGVRVHGPRADEPRTPTVSFTMAHRSSEEIARELARRGLFVSNGDFYATTVAERLGCLEDGLVRVGCACYTTDEEVGRLIEGVRTVAARSSR